MTLRFPQRPSAFQIATFLRQAVLFQIVFIPELAHKKGQVQNPPLQLSPKVKVINLLTFTFTLCLPQSQAHLTILPVLFAVPMKVLHHAIFLLAVLLWHRKPESKSWDTNQYQQLVLTSKQ